MTEDNRFRAFLVLVAVLIAYVIGITVWSMYMAAHR